jgi:hypothetical protein
MAEIRNLSLSIISGAGGASRARIEYDIHFFPIEVSLNVVFWELAAVIERDDEVDEWHNYSRHGGLWWKAKGNLDELVKWVHYGTVSPGGSYDIHRSYERDLSGPWVTGGPESGPEELRPLVYVNPQITSHLAIGDEVSANIG